LWEYHLISVDSFRHTAACVWECVCQAAWRFRVSAKATWRLTDRWNGSMCVCVCVCVFTSCFLCFPVPIRAWLEAALCNPTRQNTPGETSETENLQITIIQLSLHVHLFRNAPNCTSFFNTSTLRSLSVSPFLLCLTFSLYTFNLLYYMQSLQWLVEQEGLKNCNKENTN